FLDHHIRHGDSLFGQWVGQTLIELQNRGGLFIQGEIGKAQAAAKAMENVEILTDADITEVHQSRQHFETVKELTAPLDAFLRLFHAFKWVAGKDKARLKELNNWLDGANGSITGIALGKELPVNVTPEFIE